MSEGKLSLSFFLVSLSTLPLWWFGLNKLSSASASCPGTADTGDTLPISFCCAASSLRRNSGSLSGPGRNRSLRLLLTRHSSRVPRQKRTATACHHHHAPLVQFALMSTSMTSIRAGLRRSSWRGPASLVPFDGRMVVHHQRRA